MNESMTAAEGHSTNQTGQATPTVRLEEKQEPKSREYDVRKRLNFPRYPGTSLNKAIGG